MAIVTQFTELCTCRGLGTALASDEGVKYLMIASAVDEGKQFAS